jgi:hypothetical protein
MKRAKEYAANNQLKEYKEHVDRLATQILAARQPWNLESITEAVNVARAITDEVNRQVDAEIERTQYEIDEATANRFKGE